MTDFANDNYKCILFITTNTLVSVRNNVHVIIVVGGGDVVGVGVCC